MMRNDVKLGLAVGGVLLAVLIVYVLVVPGGSEQPGAELTVTDPNGQPVDIDLTATPPADADGYAAVPDDFPVTTTPDAIASKTGTADDPFASGRPGGSTADGAAATSNGGGWDWAKLLNGGPAPTLMSDTDVPTDAAMSGGPVARQPSQDGAVAEAAPDDANVALPQAGADVATAAPQPAPTSVLPIPATPDESAGPTVTGGPRQQQQQQQATTTVPQRTHLVQSGETFSSIAQAAYGSARYYPHIIRANPQVDPARLKPGMTITLPALTEVRPEGAASPTAVVGGTARTASASSAAAPQVDPRSEYRVESNDSLYKIAQKLYGSGLRHTEIYELNKSAIGPDPARLKLGMVLKLPAPPTAATQTASSGTR